MQAKWAEKLPEIAVQASVRERHSVDAERAVDDLKKAEFMADKVGEDFDAVVSGVAGFGMFVALPNTVEGLVHISRMKDDYYAFVENQMALVGERFHKIFRIGQTCRVHLENVDVEQRQIDFSLIPTDDTPKSDIVVKRESRGRGQNHSDGPRNGGNNRGGNNRNGRSGERRGGNSNRSHNNSSNRGGNRPFNKLGDQLRKSASKKK